MKKIFLLIISIFLILSFTSCGKKTINIGFVGPMTGDYANYGELMSQAVQIAVDEKNNEGGISGNMIKFIIEDSEGNPDKGNLAIEKLAGIDKVYGLIGAVFSGVSLAIAPKCESAKVIMISPSSTHKDLPDKGDYIFRTVLSDAFQAVVFAKYAYNEMGLRKIAILYIKNDYSQGLAEDFKKIFEKEGGTVTLMESGAQGDKDFKTQLTKIKSTDSEALFLPNYVSEIALMLEQAHQLNLSMKILSADGFTNPEIFKLAGELTNGVVYSAPEVKKDENQESFELKYEAKYGQKPDSFSLNSYDGAKILIDAIEKAYNELDDNKKSKIDINREKIKQYIAETKDYNGVSGNISFLKNGDASKNVGISTVENQAYKQLSVYKISGDDLIKVE